MPEVFEENGGGTSAGMRYYMNTRSSMKSIALFLTDHLLHSFVQIIIRFSRVAQRLQDRLTEQEQERYTCHPISESDLLVLINTYTQDVFYLSNDLKANMDIVPLSKILGDNFEEIPVTTTNPNPNYCTQQSCSYRTRF